MYIEANPAEEFESFACVFIRTPSPFGYSLLSKRESCFLFSINGLYKLLLLDKRRWPSGRRSLKVLLVCLFELPPLLGTPSYP